MDKPDFAKSIENNLFEAWKFLSGAPFVDYFENQEMIRYVSGVPFPLCNGVMRANFSDGDIEERIREAAAPIRSRQLPRFWWTGPATRPVDLGKYLEKEGLIPIEEIPGMALDLSAFGEDPSGISGLEIREVPGGKGLEAWLEVFRLCFEMPDAAIDFFRRAMIHAGLGPDFSYRHYLGLWKDEPVACSSVFLGDDSAGIYNVATLPDHRGRGIGSIMTLRPMSVARESGYRTCVLHSSAMGLPVYEKMGFREYCRLTVYLWQP